MKKIGCLLLGFMLCLHTQRADAQTPVALDTLTAEDGSIWELVSAQGFGNPNNTSIDSLLPYKGSLYALTRNDVTGAELWRTKGTGWEQVSIPGFTDSPLHKMMQGGYGDMIEYKGYLYVATSSGYEGKYLYQGIGSELWRFDGSLWEPIASYSKDNDESGTLTAISGCADGDGDLTAQFTDSTKNWTADQWKDAGLLITSGSGTGRYFKITGNTASTLTVQEIEAAPAARKENEYTICSEHAPDAARKTMLVGTVAANDSYSIAQGSDENGFGELWNKSIIDLEELDGSLYASIGHNYNDGTSVWKTSDGVTWSRITKYAHGNIHGYDPDGNPTNVCLNKGKEDTIDTPVCTSSTHFGKSDVNGAMTLYLGATGSRGCNGNGARVLRFDGDTFQFIVDGYVDANDTGTNESGFGDNGGGNALTQNFQAWHWANYDGKLFVGVARPVGGRIAYTATGSAEDDAWNFIVGYDNPLPDGFDGVTGPLVFGSNVGFHLFPYKGELYAGTLKMNLYKNPIPVIDPADDSADIWRATGPADALVWTRITPDGFGDKDMINFDGFCTFNDALYVGGGNYFGKNLDAPIPTGPGLKVYRLKEAPKLATLTSLTGESGMFSTTLSWTAGDETNITGYNIYRSKSEKYNFEYRKINRQPIAAGAAGGQYSYTDYVFRPNKTYFYKVEAVNDAAKKQTFGPLPIKTKKIMNFGG